MSLTETVVTELGAILEIEMKNCLIKQCVYLKLWLRLLFKKAFIKHPNTVCPFAAYDNLAIRQHHP